uniref:Uncharacterized protein n=1 Tax=Maylandia zebra TaxID=106582 RepID=A0A3P9DUE6_9CICH
MLQIIILHKIEETLTCLLILQLMCYVELTLTFSQIYTNSALLGPSTTSALPGPSTNSALPGPSTNSALPGPSTTSALPGPSTTSALPGPSTNSALSPGAVNAKKLCQVRRCSTVKNLKNQQ